MASQSYDFIIVGAGPAGCALASRLARSAAHPSVLLLEAGGKADNPHFRIDHDRWSLFMTPELAWGYKTVPQASLDGRVLGYDRGKGLGGSTAVNFCSWNIGPKGDFEELVEKTGDDAWSWENSRRLFNGLEDYRGFGQDVQAGLEEYMQADPKKHGHGGPLKIGFPKVWEPSTLAVFDNFKEAGYPINRDVGGDDYLGFGFSPNTAFRGKRSTAADLLDDSPSNLHIVTHAQVAKVVFDGKRAVGVALLDGTVLSASKEVILATGSLDSPRILMHSGIGPKDQLTKFGIPILHENKNVGQGLRDHCHTFLTWERKPIGPDGRQVYFNNPKSRENAMIQWDKDGTGPLAEIFCGFVIGFFKNKDILSSKEFKQLPEAVQTAASAPSIPTHEIILGGASFEYLIDPLNSPALTSIAIFISNSQSVGEILLQSADPAIPLLFDPKILSHPYDRRTAVEATRDILRVTEGPEFQETTVGLKTGPKSNSEEDILAFWRETVGSTWHMSGTLKMGQSGDESACVDTDFNVLGVQNLRVVDMSVIPIMAKNHTQTTAFLTGMIAGDKLVAQYGFDSR